MILPTFISDRSNRKFELRTKQWDKEGVHYYTVEVFSSEGIAAGYLWFRAEADERVVFQDIEVFSDYSHDGLGSQLIRIVEAEALRLGKKRIVGRVEARRQTSGKKHALAAWYRKCGYQVHQTDLSSSDYFGVLEKEIKVS